MFDIENVDIKIKCVFLLSQSFDGITSELRFYPNGFSLKSKNSKMLEFVSNFYI